MIKDGFEKMMVSFFFQRFFLLGVLICAFFEVQSTPSNQSSIHHHFQKLPEISLGKKDAPLTVVMYYSLTCGHCKEFFVEDEFKSITEKFINTGKVRWVIRDFPLDGIALKAAQVAWCRGGENYFTIAQHLLRHQETWAVNDNWQEPLFKAAKEKGITKEEFENCLQNKELEDSILEECMQGQKKFKINYAPAFVLNGTLHDGEISEKVIQNALNDLEKSSHNKKV